MRIWLPTFWGVLVLLIGTSTQKPDNDLTNPLRILLDAKRPVTKTPLTQPDHLQTDNNSSATPSGQEQLQLNSTRDGDARLPLDVTHTLAENNYQSTKEDPLTETSESLSLSYKQSLNNKNNANNINAHTLSITNNGNAGRLIPVFTRSNESVHNNKYNQEDFEISSDATNTTNVKNLSDQINEHNLTTVEKNKTEPLYITGRDDSLDISNVEHRQSPDGVLENFDEVLGVGGTARDFSSLKPSEVEEAADYGLRMMNELITVKEPQLYTMGLWIKRDDPAGRVAAFSEPNPEILRLTKFGYASLQASTKLLKTLSTSAESRNGPVRLPSTAELRQSFRDTELHSQCPLLDASIPCRPAAKRYRTADGTCNNREKSRRGAAFTPMQRFLSPVYHDGIQTPRRSVIKSASLPSPRLISTQIHRPRHIDAPSVTHLLMQWGQFIDHDITSTPQSRAFNGSTPRCCDHNGNMLPLDLLHPECMPIEVPSDDWFYGRFGLRCMEFIRSAATIHEGCDFGHRQQLNQVTVYIDASTIYGSSVSQSDNIRIFRGGMIHYGQPDPPNGGEPCRAGAVAVQCLRPGDGRASEQPGLTAFHSTWVRKHNMLATALGHLNPHWSDEKMFQETRRIVGALIQHINYREYLPIILGHEVMKLFDLELIRKGYYTGYDSRVNPAISNGFSAAAYRFGHSLVQSSLLRFDRIHRPLFSNITLHNEQSNDNVQNIWSPGSVDRLMLGLVNQPSQRRDEFITEELTNHLFQSPGFPFGMDLAAINIQRGRDHGIPSYTAWRQPCGLSPIKNWTDLQRVMSVETAERFRSLYLSVDDIDLYSAGLAERPVRGGLVGPTFACIIAQQFSNLRKGDRFWYENGNFESSFTPAQLQQIRKVTFAQIICETMTQVDTIQPFVFLTADQFRNQRTMCRDLVDFDLTPWIEKLPDFDQTNKMKPVVHGHEHFTDNDIESKTAKNNDEKLKAKNMRLNITENNTSNKTDQIRTKRDTLQLNETLIPINHSNLNSSRYLRNNYDKIEHRELDDDLTLPLLENDTIKPDKLLIERDVQTQNLTDFDSDLARNERKRKQPIRNKTKNKNTNKITTPAFVTTTARPIKTKHKFNSDLKQVNVFSSEYNTRPNDYNEPNRYYETYELRPLYQNEVVIGTTKKPSNLMTYLVNNVQKPTTTTTPKPDYQFHIQINYFYNSTTETYPQPTTPTTIKRPFHNYDYSKPNNFDYRPNTNLNYDTFRQTTRAPYNRPIYHEFDNLNPVYSASSNTYNVYNNDRNEISNIFNRIPTQRPEVVSSTPITVINIKPPNLNSPQQPNNRPNVYVVNGDNYDQNTPRPTYNIFNRPQSFENNRPVYETRPNTLVYKRPVTGQVTKLDSKPVLVYEPQNNPNFYGTEVVYDNLYPNYGNRQPARPNFNNINDKLDFLTSADNTNYVKISSTKKNMFTTARPYYNDDKKYIRISTVKGQASSTNSLNPIYISVQNKEGDDDLEMTYDDLLEVYVKPDANFKYVPASNTTSDNSDTSDKDLKTLPLLKQNQDDICSTELPKPMHLFIDDDLFDL